MDKCNYLLHGFKFVLMGGFPVQVIIGQEQDTGGKWYNGNMFVGNGAINNIGIYFKKFTQHPE